MSELTFEPRKRLKGDLNFREPVISYNDANEIIRGRIMPDKQPLSLVVPQDIMRLYGSRVRTLRIQARITQKELAQRAGVSEGTIKRFEHVGEIQLRSLLAIALVLGRLDEFTDIFKFPDVPASLYKPEKKPLESRQRARKKCV